MSTPTRQEIIDAHSALKHLISYDLSDAYTEAEVEEVHEREQLIRKFLPPFPRPTMNEIEWDDDEHFLAEAEHPDWGKVVMLRESALIIFVQPIEKRMGDIHVARVEELTPTGKRYTLTEVHND